MGYPLVEVLVATYNHERYIKNALDSILNQQTNFEFHIHIGEDCSQDKTREIVKEYKDKFPDKITLHLRDKNLGLQGPFSNGVLLYKNAKSKYLAILDGDDYWCDRKKLQKQVDFLEKHPECIACHTWHKIAEYDDSAGKYIERPAPKSGHGYNPGEVSTVEDIFANKLRVKSRTVIYRNQIDLPDWFFKVPYGDVAISMIMGKKGDFGFIDEATAVYRKTSSGVSSRYKDKWGRYRHQLNWIEIWEYGNNYHNNTYFNTARIQILKFYISIFEHYKYSFRVFVRLLYYALFRSKLGVIKRFGIALRLVKYYFSPV